MRKKAKIMIIDDEEDFAVTLAERLNLRNFGTKIANGAVEAMTAIQQGWKPDIVILDLKMPGLDGIQTLSLLKQHDPSVEVILLTGHGSTSAAIEGMQKGLFDYLMKPVDIGVIVEKIELAMQKKGM